MSGGSGKTSGKSGDASGRKTPAAGTAAREKLPTLTDAKELEEARRRSLAEVPSTPPKEGPKAHPSNPLAMVNKNVPSVPPAPPANAFSLPKAPPQLVLDEGFTDLDRGWGDEHSAESAPLTKRVDVPEVTHAKEPEKPAPKEIAKKPPPPLPSKAAATTSDASGASRASPRVSSRKMKAAPAAPAVPAPPPPTHPSRSNAMPPPRIVVPPPIPLGQPIDRVVPPAPPTRPTPLGLSAPSKSFHDDDEPEEDTTKASTAPTAPPPAEPASPSQREAMKVYPSARSLVAEVDADAMISTLGDDDPQSSPSPNAAVTAAAPPMSRASAVKSEPREERREKETTPAPLPGGKSPLASTLNAASGPQLGAEKSADKRDKPTPPKSGEEGAREMRDRYSLGDYTGALEIAEKILAKDPADQEAVDMAQNCRATLEQMYTTRIGPLDRVPVVMVPSEQLRWLSIDHRAGFVLSNIDGVSSLEMIIDVSGMTTLDALRILCELAQQRIISFR